LVRISAAKRLRDASEQAARADNAESVNSVHVLDASHELQLRSAA